MGIEQLEAAMAAIRKLESGSYEGNYSVVNEIGARGAYQILTGNWASWAAQANIPGADWRDPRAQDAVARHMMLQYYRKYRSWDLVAMAWHGGQGTVDRYLRTGRLGPNTTRYVKNFGPAMAGFEGSPPGEELESMLAKPGSALRDYANARAAQTDFSADDNSGWYWPMFLSPADQLAQFFESLGPAPDAEGGPPIQHTLAASLNALSRAITERSSLGLPEGDANLGEGMVDMSPSPPDIEGSPYEELKDQG